MNPFTWFVVRCDSLMFTCEIVSSRRTNIKGVLEEVDLKMNLYSDGFSGNEIHENSYRQRWKLLL